jgi:cytochrome c biogenesis protein CcdA
MLSALQKQFPHLTVKSFDLSLVANKKLAEAMGHHCGLSEDRRLITPSLFIGQDALVTGEIREARVRDLIERYQTSAGKPIWELVAADTSLAAQGIIQRFQSLGVLTVMAAGLIDGVNPCAFATIIFFISYLTLVGRQRREMLLVGAAFTAAVFLTYLTMGLGLFQFLQRITFMVYLSKIIYGLMALMVLVLGVISLYDFVLIRRGHTPSEMKLQLPLFLKRRIHATIRDQSRSGHLVVGALVCGAVISVMELACTGQVYLPTIAFVVGISHLRAHAFLYLLVYNLLFVLPLAIVFLVSYRGVTSQQMAAAMEAHLDRVKLVLGLFFLCLCGLLVYVLLT